MKIANNLTDLIGNTPLLALEKYGKLHEVKGNLIAKLEYFNPGGSVKDRIGYAMIHDAMEKGLLKEGSVIVEPTSGNTGIALAYVGTSLGFKVILTMPETMSEERRNMLKALGAELVLTPGSEGMKGAINKAVELAREIPNAYLPDQFNNPANPEIHRKTTALEIWRDTEGKVDAFVAGIGTGGTITGTAEVLKEKNPAIKVFAVEPDGSAVLSGETPGPHKIQGIGAGFIPGILNVKIFDEIIRVTNEDAFKTAKEVGRLEGVLVGISSGAALYAATQVAKKEEYANKNIVVLLPDTGERYLSTELFE